jgi:hypothetical protein
MAPARRLLALATVVGLLFAATAVAADADTQADLDTARQALAGAREAANAAAADFSAADQKLAATAQHIEQLQREIAEGKAKAAALRDIARRRAVFAYTHGSHTELDAIVDGTSSPLEAIRRQQLLDHANQTDNTVVHQLARSPTLAEQHANRARGGRRRLPPRPRLLQDLQSSSPTSRRPSTISRSGSTPRSPQPRRPAGRSWSGSAPCSPPRPR